MEQKKASEIEKTMEQITTELSVMLHYSADSINAGKAPDYQTMQQKDKVIDSLEKRIDELAVEYIARHSPHASELRYIVSVLKMTSDLERIGDECKNLSRDYSKGQDPLPEELISLSELSTGIALSSFDLLVSRDPNAGRIIISQDDTIDSLFYDILKKYPGDLRTTFMAKSLERIADHAVNIAENIIYASEGTDIRHFSQK